ncbi:MAG: glycosyltransferase family 61 protein [Streptosporangiaceae bacterium]
MGDRGAAITEDGCLVVDLTRAWGRSLEDHPIWELKHPPPAVHVRGTAAVVAARGADYNFSHFLADTLPRIQLVRDSGVCVDTWLVSSVKHGWQREALALAGIPAGDVVALDATPLVRASALLVPTRTGFAPRTAPWARRRLRAFLLPRPVPPGGRRLLISRASAARRRLANEDRLASALQPLGFEHVAIERLHVRDQIKLIASSEAIVAPHGAALAHLLHAPPGGLIVEITHPGAVHPEYWGLAALSGWTYKLILGEATATHLSTSPTVDSDLLADIDEVLATLRAGG